MRGGRHLVADGDRRNLHQPARADDPDQARIRRHFCGNPPLVVDEEGRMLTGPAEGRLCLAHPWPGQARTVWGDHERYVQTYFETVHYYFCR